MNRIVAAVVAGIVCLIIVSAFSGKNGWQAPREAESRKNPLANDPKAAKAGAVLYKQYCEICHGSKGKGDGTAESGLQTPLNSLASETTQKNADGTVFWKISTGHAQMPAYKSLLTDQQIWQLVNFVKTLGKKI